MTGTDWILLAVAGGLGAGARYVVDGVVMKGRKGAFPLGILIVNAVGSFLLGVLTGLGAALAPAWVAVIGVGALGGFTTFSTVSVETVLLAGRGRRDWAWLNLLGTFGVCLAAAALGILLGGLAPR